MKDRNINGANGSAKIDRLIDYLKKSNRQTQDLIWQFERDARRDREENRRIHEDLVANIAEIRANTSELKSNVGELKANTTELKANVTELKANVTELKANVTELKANVTELKEFNREQAKLNAIFAKAILKKLNE